MKILVTGGAGFIGSALIRHLIKKTDFHILNIDSLTYASNPKSLNEIHSSDRYSFKKIDICDSTNLAKTIYTYKPNIIMHLAAESHVDRSIENADAFIMTNVLGTYNLLNQCLLYFRELGNKEKQQFKFHHISTDEVYGDLPHPDDDKNHKKNLFTEQSPYMPSSPYSASKASSDHLVRAWSRTYQLPTLITNCSNNYGPFQHKEKFIPKIIINALNGQNIPVYGDGRQIRDWLYVDDHVDALVLSAISNKINTTYNIGGFNEYSNLEVVLEICKILNKLVPPKNRGLKVKKYEELILFVEDRLGHDRRYAIDASKIYEELAWKPKETFESGLLKTIKWYLKEF